MAKRFVDHSLEGYRPIRRSPLEEKRTNTDSFFLYVFVIICFTWVSGILYGSFFKEHLSESGSSSIPEYLPKFLIEYKKKYEENRDVLSDFFASQIFMVCLNITITFLGVLFLLKFFQHLPKICVSLGTIFSILIVGILISNIYGTIKNKFYDNEIARDEEKAANDSTYGLLINYYKGVTGKRTSGDESSEFFYGMIPVIMNSIVVFYYILALMCIMASVNICEIAAIMKNIFRVYFSLFGFIPFGFLVCGLQVSIMAMSIKSFMNLGTTDLLSYVILLTGTYLNNVIFYYAMTVVSQMTAFWHWSDDKNGIPKTLLFRCMGSVIRNHLGTIALNATIILPIIVAIVAALSVRCRTPRGSSSNCFVDVFLIHFLIFNITEYSLAATALTGQSFYHATKTTYFLLKKNSPLSLSFIFIYSSTIFLGTMIMMVISAIPMMYWGLNDKTMLELAPTVIFLFALFFAPIAIMISFIEKANLLCMMDEDEDERPNPKSIPMIYITRA